MVLSFTPAPGASEKFLSKFAKATLEASLPGHTCEGRPSEAIRCKKCLSRKVTNSLALSESKYVPKVVTEHNYEELLAEYDGSAWEKRAAEDAEYRANAKRMCECGHNYHSHSIGPRRDDHTECRARNGYGYEYCSCLTFRDKTGA